MEPDRYQKHQALYIIGMISLLISLSLLLFSMYMMPHLLFGWRYDVPEFISLLREWLVTEHGMQVSRAAWLIFCVFLGFSVLFGLIAGYTSTTIDKDIDEIHPEETTQPLRIKLRIKQSVIDSLNFLWKILGILLLVYAATFVFHWLLSVTSP